ncbi:hypothetical protein C8J56DRAFT_946062 [Mycena floridula]|nr:hypothetical protein C8J56DRAFT_946062 [Mycena floridula]
MLQSFPTLPVPTETYLVLLSTHWRPASAHILPRNPIKCFDHISPRHTVVEEAVLTWTANSTDSPGFTLWWTGQGRKILRNGLDHGVDDIGFFDTPG